MAAALPAFLFALLACIPAGAQTAALRVTPYPIQSDERKALTREYAKAHYGLDTWRLENPKAIVIHYTATDSQDASLLAFKAARLGADRSDITAGGALNVGIHYLIARDGRVWSLLPEDAMARHAVGFNHLALGIEMVGATEKSLTAEQLATAARLVADMVRRNPTVAYLIGHHEYLLPGKPHSRLFLELQRDYVPPVKTDPGPAFMAALREKLDREYSLRLLD
jgi:N-acetylmuramoyl-L-alanine amidase